MVTGRLDINVKALVEMLAAETVTDAVPELVALMVRVLLLPLVIVPKPSDDAPMESRPDAGGVPVPVTPAQPVHIMTEKSRATTANVSNGRDEIRLGAEDDIDSWEANHVSSPSQIPDIKTGNDPWFNVPGFNGYPDHGTTRPRKFHC
jgi:hypothetical protein